METMLLEAECRSEHGYGYPKFIKKALSSFDRCGLLEQGFSRLKCQGCGHERLVAFSCKSKCCDSCHARRSMDLSIHLVSQVLPKVPYRQWTITFPRSIRFLLARDKKLLSKIFGCVIRSIFSWQKKQVKNEGFEEVYPGAVGLLQNFGGALNANFHAHNVLMDGVFVGNKEEALCFIELEPTTQDIHAILQKIIGKVERILCKYQEEHDSDEHTAYEQLLAESVLASQIAGARDPGQ
jgi:hypothetical protein